MKLASKVVLIVALTITFSICLTVIVFRLYFSKYDNYGSTDGTVTNAWTAGYDNTKVNYHSFSYVVGGKEYSAEFSGYKAKKGESVVVRYDKNNPYSAVLSNDIPVQLPKFPFIIIMTLTGVGILYMLKHWEALVN